MRSLFRKFTNPPDKAAAQTASMPEQCVVDNLVFLLGLDGLYREAMKRHERAELLNCVRRVARRLGVVPADVPVEGYYAEEGKLAKYFRLLRALQQVEASRIPEVASMLEYQRLRAVTSAPLYGVPQDKGKLLPVGRDALSRALDDTRPDWSGERLTALAAELAREMDDISLVGLAARTRDPVILAAVRESSVAYARVMAAGIRPRREYVWLVDDDLAEVANRFIDAFHTLFREELPPPVPTQAERFWNACRNNKILGRCVRIGYDDRVSPVRHYHWGVCVGTHYQLAVQEFWSSHVWTTAAYRHSLGPNGGSPHFNKEARANEFMKPSQAREIMMFPELFRERIRTKYARWAVDLTDGQLEALLWAVGEYGYRAHEPLRVLHEHLPTDPFSHARALLALKVLAEFTNGKPIALDRYRERLWQVQKDTRRAMTGPNSPMDNETE